MMSFSSLILLEEAIKKFEDSYRIYLNSTQEQPKVPKKGLKRNLTPELECACLIICVFRKVNIKVGLNGYA